MTIKNNNKHNNLGYTLIEFIIYIALFSILLLVTLEMFASIFDIQVESQATSAVSEDGKYITQRFTYDMNSATGISTPNFYGTASATLTLVINGENIVYSLDSGNLIRENETIGTSDQLNSFGSNVSDLFFRRLDGAGADNVQINYTLTSNVIRKGVGAEVKTIQTTAGLR